MTAFQAFSFRILYFFLGWSRVPRGLEAQIAEVLDGLPGSFDDRVLIIPRVPPWRLVVLFGCLLAGIGWIISKKASGSGEAWIAGGALFGATFTLAMLRSHPLMLLLGRDGACFIHRNCEVLCPWSLFAAAGEPTHYGMFLILPINPDAIADIEVRKNGQIVQRSEDVRTDAISFLGDTQLKLSNTLQVPPPMLGMLLQELAFALMEEQAEVATTDTAQSRVTEVTTTPAAHWTRNLNLGVVEDGCAITLPVTRLQFPPACCCCGIATNQQTRIDAPGRVLIFPSRTTLY